MLKKIKLSSEQVSKLLAVAKKYYPEVQSLNQDDMVMLKYETDIPHYYHWEKIHWYEFAVAHLVSLLKPSVIPTQISNEDLVNYLHDNL